MSCTSRKWPCWCDECVKHKLAVAQREILAKKALDDAGVKLAAERAEAYRTAAVIFNALTPVQRAALRHAIELTPKTEDYPGLPPRVVTTCADNAKQLDPHIVPSEPSPRTKATEDQIRQSEMARLLCKRLQAGESLTVKRGKSYSQALVYVGASKKPLDLPALTAADVAVILAGLS